MRVRNHAVMNDWKSLNRSIVACQRCPRLIQYCHQVGSEKRRAYDDWEYWAKPVPNFGEAPADLLIVGLAPAAHGANRTGRMFTGDRSGEWLYRALHRAGFANQPQAHKRGDGLRLNDCVITAVCHCAPPLNKPKPEEQHACREWFDLTWKLTRPRVVIALGQIAWQAIFAHVRRTTQYNERRPKFAHGVVAVLPGDCRVIASYHPSQQNTFTGRLTEPMFDAVFRSARRLLEVSEDPA